MVYFFSMRTNILALFLFFITLSANSAADRARLYDNYPERYFTLVAQPFGELTEDQKALRLRFAADLGEYGEIKPYIQQINRSALSPQGKLDMLWVQTAMAYENANFDQATDHLEAIEQRAKQQSNAFEEISAILTRANFAFFTGQYAFGLELLEQAHLRQESSKTSLRGSIEFYYSLLFYQQNDPTNAFIHMQKAGELGVQESTPITLLRVQYYLAIFELSQGNLVGAEQALANMQASSISERPYQQHLIHQIQAQIASQKAQTESYEAQFAQAQQAIEQTQSNMFQIELDQSRLLVPGKEQAYIQIFEDQKTQIEQWPNSQTKLRYLLGTYAALHFAYKHTQQFELALNALETQNWLRGQLLSTNNEIRERRLQAQASQRELSNENEILRLEQSAQNTELAAAQTRALYLRVLVAALVTILLLVALILRQNLRNQKRLRNLAMQDPLTQLPNRRVVNKVLQTLQHNNDPYCLLAIDADHFKAINDTHGHDVGDEVLVELAKRLQSQMRSRDIVARVGGEEFIAIIRSSQLQDCQEIAERIRLHVAHSSMATQAGDISVQVSIGGVHSLHRSEDKHMLRQADDALYKAKDLGRNQVVWQQP